MLIKYKIYIQRNKSLDELKWVYPIHAVTVVNAVSKATPFVLECIVRNRLEKRMEVILTGANHLPDNNKVLKIRPATPKTATPIPEVTADSGFTHSIQYTGNLDQIEIVQNAIAMKLIRVQKDKQSGLVMLLFDFIFWPSKSFM